MILRMNSLATKNFLRITGIFSRSNQLGVKCFSSSHDDASSDDKKKKAKAKLDDLLKSIVESKDAVNKVEPSTPIKHKLAIRKPPKPKPTEPPKQKDVKPADKIPVEQKPTEVKLKLELVTAAKTLGTTLKDPLIENELVQKLKTQQNGEKVNISDLFEGMKIEKPAEKHKEQRPRGSDEFQSGSRAQQVRNVLMEKGVDFNQLSVSESLRRQSPARSQVNIFGSRPLGIFPSTLKDQPRKTISILETWDMLEKKELQLAVSHPPANGFDEMIRWTEQGKMWHFPIDNEQGITEEAKVPFTDHVFLTPHIESWCPSKGPIRHFMELVCTSLSKNPHLTSLEKREYIEWYHQYFKNKATIIKEVGAGEIK